MLPVLVMEPGVLDRIPAATRNGIAIDRRLVLRSLANHAPAFNGTVASLQGVSLSNHGVY